MTNLIEVWTINKSSEFVPEYITHLDMFEWNYGIPPSVYVADNKFHDTIKMVVLPIINIRECKGLLNKFGKPEYKVQDRYIAIHPELEEIVANKYKQNIYDCQARCEELEKVLGQQISLIDNFTAFPWWKRIWLAFNGELS